MSLFNVFNIAGSGMSAQSVRMNVTASNLANSESVATRPEDAYKARQPVFQSVLDDANESTSVRTAGIVESGAENEARYAPGHPMADEKGYIYASNVNAMEEMANMIILENAYSASARVISTTS